MSDASPRCEQRLAKGLKGTHIIARAPVARQPGEWFWARGEGLRVSGIERGQKKKNAKEDLVPNLHVERLARKEIPNAPWSKACAKMSAPDIHCAHRHTHCILHKQSKGLRNGQTAIARQGLDVRHLAGKS